MYYVIKMGSSRLYTLTYQADCQLYGKASDLHIARALVREARETQGGTWHIYKRV